jgi:hypothetical protein
VELEPKLATIASAKKTAVVMENRIEKPTDK